MRNICLCLLLSFLSPAWLVAQAPPPPAPPPPNPVDTLCKVPDPGPGVLKYLIDLSNATPSGKRHYKTDDQVQIVLKNKNPFVFEYRVTVEEQAIPEPALATFFKLFDTSPTAALLASVKAPGEKSGPTPLPTCLAALQDLENLNSSYNSLKSQADKITVDFAKLKEGSSPEKKFVDGMTCPDLVRAAQDLIASVESELDPAQGNLGKELAKFNNDLKAYGDALAQQTLSPAGFRIALKNANCPDVLINRGVQDYTTLLDSLDPRNDKGLLKVAKSFEAATTEAKATLTKISDMLKSAQNFTEARFTGDFDTPTLVTVKVDRKVKNPATDFASYLTTKLRFGGRQRFALAAGAGFSRLEQTTYKVSQGLAPDTDHPGQNKVIQVIGVDEHSNGRAVPLVMLHARISEQHDWFPPIHGSFGFAGNTANNGLNLEYLVGLSASFAEERFFFTIGRYNGRTQSLQKGFSVGQELPTGITEVPVTHGRSWGWGFALTVRFM